MKSKELFILLALVTAGYFAYQKQSGGGGGGIFDNLSSLVGASGSGNNSQPAPVQVDNNLRLFNIGINQPIAGLAGSTSNPWVGVTPGGTPYVASSMYAQSIAAGKPLTQSQIDAINNAPTMF